MLQAISPGKIPLPLSIRLSLWLVGVAILPLLLAVLISEVQSRTTLINQASTLMETDARTHAQLIDNYLANKEAIIGSLSNDPNVRFYFLNPQTFPAAQLKLFIGDGLALEKFLYPEVSLIEFFTPQGKPLLNYSIYNVQPHLHGASLVPAIYLQRVLQGQQFFSGVYYDPTTHTSTLELYTPSFDSPTSGHVIGFVRDTLKLDSVLNIVNGEKGANGSGSYAFLLDQNGI
ncbi:MAG TPA: cache domain-containing protein, partial [Ktedonobacteraceae bacterium]|nr:cache domain-containing protein [Ktedonobacteraceae bacterium]